MTHIRNPFESESAARPLAKAPKTAAKEAAKKHSTVEEKNLVLDRWRAHVARYQLSLGTSDPSVEPPVRHFEDENGLF